MKHLDDEELLQTVNEYLDRESDYAILIDGEWGCGKTYFVEKKLIPNIKTQNKVYAYISLYGITSKNEIDRKIIEKNLESFPKIGGLLKLAYKGSSILGELAKINFKDTSIEELFKDENAKDIIDKFTNIENTILIFDDLERCQLPFNEILGYINEYVEHSNCKAIIIANQKEIAKTKNMENMELKYMAIKSFYTEFKSLNEKDLKENIPTIDKTTLDSRVEELFQGNLEYNQIKEKVIGRVLYYKPNLEEVLRNLVNTSKLIDGDRKFILEYTENIIEVLEWNKHANIRTLKFSIEILEKLLPILSTIDVNENQKSIFESCKYYILIYTIYASILEKKGVKRSKWNNISEYTQFLVAGRIRDQIIGFKFIDEIIETGIIDKDKIIGIIRIYLDDMENSILDSNDPVNNLSIFFELNDNVVIQNLKEMEKRLIDKNYKLERYSKVVEILVKLKHAGFEDDIINRILQLMKENIKKEKESFYLKEFDIMFNTEDEREEYILISDELKSLVNISYKEQKEYQLKELISKENWGVEISQYYLKHWNDGYFNDAFLSLFDIDILVNNIFSSDSRNISDFRRTVEDVYRYDNIKELYLLDFENINNLKEQLKEQINKNSIDSITKKYNIELLIKDLEEIIIKFE